MKAIYQGVEGMVTVGNHPLKPGDVLTDDQSAAGKICVDTVSLRRLVARGDFECSGPVTIIAPNLPAPEMTDEELTDG